MKVLVTGHEGFIGRHFYKAAGDLSWGATGIDIKSGSDCRDLFAQPDPTRFDMVIHCAAMVGGRAKIDGDPLAVAQNLAIDSDLFRWAVRGGTDRIVYFSSSAAYPIRYQNAEDTIKWCMEVEGEVDSFNLREDYLDLTDSDTELDDAGWLPDQTYGWAKLTGEMLAQHAEAEGVRTHIFRPFSGYGTDQDDTYPFPAFIARALRREDPFEVWGTGEQSRDFIHVDDIVATVLAAVDQDYPGPLNLCTGRATSFLQLADMVTYAAGYDPIISTLPDKPVGVYYRVGDPKNMLTVREPRVTLEEGIKRAQQGVD